MYGPANIGFVTAERAMDSFELHRMALIARCVEQNRDGVRYLRNRCYTRVLCL